MRKVLQRLALLALLAVPLGLTAQSTWCTPSPSSVDNSGISNVTFGTSSEMVNDNLSWTSSPYYADHRSMVGAVSAGLDCELSITFSTGYTYGYVIWVDWNNDSVFSGTEVVCVGEAPGTNPTVVTASFTVPVTQDTGTYAMRICAADYNFDSYTSSISAAASAPPCASYTYGVGIDYTLHVLEAANCFPVQSVSASDILYDGMTIVWVDTLNTTTYTLTYWPNGASVGDTVEVYNINDTSYTLSNLDASTLYYFTVVPDCGDVLPRSGSAMTDCENGSCFITVNAIDSFGDGWNGNEINVMQSGALMGSATIENGSSATVQVHVCKGAPVQITYTRGSYPGEMGGTVTDGGGAVIFTIESMGNYSNGAVLANVAIPCPDCIAPNNINLDTIFVDDNTGTATATITWTSSASTFMVYADDSLYSDAVTDTTFTFTNLGLSNIVQLGVAAICDGDDTSAISSISAATPCGDISVMPFSTGFEFDAAYTTPMCWNVLRSVSGYSGDYPYVYTYTTHTGSRCLYFYATYDDDTSMIVTSPITYNPGNLHVKFWAYPSLYYGATFEAGLMTDTSDMSTFISLFSLNNASPNYVSYTYNEFEFFTDESGLEDGDTAYLAFRLVGSQTGYSYGDGIYIDDINVRAIPNCRMPIAGSGNVDSIQHESAYFSWDGTSENGYDLMLVHYEYDTTGTITDTVVSHIFSDSTFISVDTLISNTYYIASVATICEIDGETDTTDYLNIGQFQTLLRCYPVYQANIDAVTATAAVISWNFRENMGIDGTGAILTLNDLSNPTAPATTQVITGTNNTTYTGLAYGHTYSVTIDALCGATDTGAAITLYFTTHTPECTQAFTDAEVGTSYSSTTPMYGYYDYSYSQTIYSDDMLAGLDTLTGAAYNSYFYSDNYIGVNSYEVDMYIGYVDTSDLTYYNGQYWLNAGIPVDSTMTHVATGTRMSVTNNGWYYIPFDTPFAVPAQDSSKRLIVTVVNHTLGIENSNNYWRCKYEYVYDANYYSYYKARYFYAYSAINPASTSSYGTSYQPNIQFFGNCGGDCLAPTASITGVTGTTIDVNWLANGTETSWRVEYKLATDTGWTLAATATAAPYTITGLTGGTGYQVRVGAICTDTVVYSSVINTFTACVSVLPPYSVLFTTANPCWTSNLSSPNATNGYNIYSNYYLLSPEFGVSLDTLAITITDRCYGTTSTNQRYIVSACDADGTNKVQLASIAATEGSNFGTHTIYLAGYTGTQNHIIIERDPAGGDVYIRQVDVNYLPACMPAINVVQDTATPTSMTLSWTVASANNGFTVNYRLNGTSAWSTATTTTGSITLTGLTHSSNYEVIVTTNCTDGTTMLTDAMIFPTACVPVATPYNVPTFYSMPACWQTYNTGHPYYTWESSIDEGYGYIFSYASGSNSPVNDWLITPAIVIPATAAADSVMLVYQVAGEPSSYYATSLARYELLVSTNGGSALTDFTDTLIVDTLNVTTFTYRRFSMSQFAGDTVRFAFHSSCVNYGMVGIYDFGVRSVLAPLYYMNGNGSVFTGDTNTYSAVYVEGDTTTMTFTWTSSMAAAGQATLLNANSANMSVIYSAGGTDTLTLVATNAYGSDTVRGLVMVFDCSPINIFPYTEGFNVDNACWTKTYGDGNNAVNPMTITSSFASSMTAHEGSNAFRFSSYSSSSDYNQYLISPELNGADMVLNFWYAKYNSNLTERIRVGYSSTTRDTSAFTWSEWIDSNDISYTDWTEFTDSIPNGTKFVAIQYWGDYAYYVYIDDLTITGHGACQAPVITGIVRDENALTVNYSSDADSVEVIVTDGLFDPAASGVIATGGSYTATGLTHSTTYTVALRAYCSQSSISDWTVDTASTLMVDCQTPTNLAVQATTYTTATIGWTVNGFETAWGVRAYNTIDTFNFVANTNPFTITGLTSGVTYNVEVRALCGQNSDIEGDWSDALQVTTDVCAPVTDVAVSDITSNSATVSWNAATGALGYKISYGDSNFYDADAHTVEVDANTTSYAMTGLDADWSYEVFVQTKCGDNLYSSVATEDRIAFHTASSSEGIYDVESGTLTLYPNPASTSVTLSVSGIDGEATVEVVDMNGRTVATYTTVNHELGIDVSSLGQGAYFVRVTGERQTAVRKLIVR